MFLISIREQSCVFSSAAFVHLIVYVFCLGCMLVVMDAKSVGHGAVIFNGRSRYNELRGAWELCEAMRLNTIVNWFASARPDALWSSIWPLAGACAFSGECTYDRYWIVETSGRWNLQIKTHPFEAEATCEVGVLWVAQCSDDTQNSTLCVLAQPELFKLILKWEWIILCYLKYKK